MSNIKLEAMNKEIESIIEATSMGKLEKEAVTKSLLDLYNVSQSEFRDSLITKTETMEEFAKLHYQPEYFEGVRNALRNMRVNINLIYDKHFG